MQRATWTDERLDDLARHIDVRFDRVDDRFKHVDERFEQIDRRFEQVDKRFEQIDYRFERVDRRFDRVENEIGGLRLEMSGMRTEIRREMGVMHSGLQSSIETLQATLTRTLIGLVLCLLGVLAAATLAS
jgi:DNA anti-recombination protein RmuC